MNNVEKRGQKSVLFIGREGYFLKPLAEHMRSQLRLRSTATYSYLNASRGFVFKLLLDQPNLVELTLSQPYRGTIRDFFMDRYFLTKEEGELFSGNMSYVTVELPRDKDIILNILVAKGGGMSERLSQKRTKYVSHVMELTDGEPPVFVDIGFSGTIQKCVGALLARDTFGYYFFKSKKFSENAPPGDHEGEAFWVEEAEFGKQDPLVDFSLVLESLLTAPWGTLKDIRVHGNGEFVYDDYVPLLKHFFVLEAIIAGVRHHIDDFVRAGISLEQWNEVLDVRRVYDLTLRFDRSEEMNFVRELFEIDDRISGFGKVKPFNFLPGL